ALIFLISRIHLDSVVGIAIGAPSVLLCAIWFLTPPGRRERVCITAGAGCILAVVGLLVWETASTALRNRQEARMQEAQKQQAVQAAVREQEARARTAELGREIDAHWKQALALGAQGRHAEAVEHWNQAIALHRQRVIGPDETAGQLRQGRALT